MNHAAAVEALTNFLAERERSAYNDYVHARNEFNKAAKKKPRFTIVEKNGKKNDQEKVFLGSRKMGETAKTFVPSKGFNLLNTMQNVFRKTILSKDIMLPLSKTMVKNL